MHDHNSTANTAARLDQYTDEPIEIGRRLALGLLASYDNKEAVATQRERLLSREQPMAWPPGVAGDIARAIYCSSFLPQQQVSIVATLALLSGVTGRAYRTPTDATLSQYYLLIAPTGSGKDEIYKSIPTLIQLSGPSHLSGKFVVAEKFVSGPALHRTILERKGLLALHPEFGKRLATIASPGAKGGNDQEVGNLLTAAYEKQFMEGVTRSKAEDSLPGVPWPALSFLGETTPRTFYEAITVEMMEDGFFSRFLTMEVTTERPQSNPGMPLILDGNALEQWQRVVESAIDINGIGHFSPPVLEPTKVQYRNPPVVERFDDFEELCRQRVNESNKKNDAFGAAVWNRAHIKALKIASLLAVADNYAFPAIHLGHTVWAIDLVKQDASTFLDKVDAGDVGDGDDTRQAKVMQVCKKVLQGHLQDKNPKLNAEGAVSRRVLQLNTSRLAPFKNHPLKASKALDETIKALIANSNLMPISKIDASEQFGFHGDCYRVLDLD